MSVRCVQVKPRRGLEHEAAHWRRGVILDLAAVVAVGRRNEVVFGVEMHFASAHARGSGPCVREVPGALRVHVGVVADVVLVTTQGALHSERGADEIVVAATKLVLPVVACARHPRQGPAGQLALP